MLKAAVVWMLLAFPLTTWSAMFYGGVTVGEAKYDGDEGLAHGIYAGTGILPWVGVEAGYANHGKFDFPSGRVRAESAYVDLRPSVSFGPLQLYAKLGVNSWVLEGENNVTVRDDDGFDKMWGLGMDYTLWGPFAFGVEYVSYSVGSKDIESVNATATLYIF